MADEEAPREERPRKQVRFACLPVCVPLGKAPWPELEETDMREMMDEDYVEAGEEDMPPGRSSEGVPTHAYYQSPPVARNPSFSVLPFPCRPEFMAEFKHNEDRLQDLSGGPICPVGIEFMNLNLFLGSRLTHVLKDVTASFEPGFLTAVLGLSGAGKTTLLNLLAINTSGRIAGDVLVNGRSLKQVAGVFKRMQGLVPVEDTLMPSLTVRETLMYAADLRLPSSWNHLSKASLIDQALEEMGLGLVADKRVGGNDHLGLKAGDRKRLNIAVELLTNPAVLLVDEPLTGLDSETTEDVALRLRSLAQQSRTVLCTVHQPSYKLLCIFDRVVIMARGLVMYCGPARRLEQYLQELAYPVPRSENPADYLLNVVQKQGRQVLMSFVKAWDDRRSDYEYVSGAAFATESKLDTTPLTHQPLVHQPNHSIRKVRQQREEDYDSEEEDDDDESDEEMGYYGGRGSYKDYSMPWLVSSFYQFIVLFRRTFKDYAKDRTKLLTGFVLKALLGLLIGITWLRQFRMTQASIYPVAGALFMLVTSCFLDAAFSAVTVFPLMRKLLLREYRNYYYGLVSFFFAVLAVHVCINTVYAFLLGTPVYLLIGVSYSYKTYLIFLAALVMQSCVGVALGLLLGALVHGNLAAAQTAILPVVAPLVIFCDFLIPYAYLPVYVRMLYWASPWFYSMSILQINMYQGKVFSDCPNPPPMADGLPLCFPTGDFYLRAVNAMPPHKSFDFEMMLAIFVALSIGAWWALSRSVQRKMY